jgi:hypothetical protein
MTAYSKAALWDAVEAWFKGGPKASGASASKAAAVHTFSAKGGATWQIYPPNAPEDKKVPLAWSSFVRPIALDDVTYGYRWNKDMVSKTDPKDGPLVTLPEYYRLGKDRKAKELWMVVSPKDVPAETGLAKVAFKRPREASPPPYVTPDDVRSCWKKPGPVAGPFQANLGDGSVVTYYWYRFADQPALLNADLTDADRKPFRNEWRSSTNTGRETVTIFRGRR